MAAVGVVSSAHRHSREERKTGVRRDTVQGGKGQRYGGGGVEAMGKG